MSVTFGSQNGTGPEMNLANGNARAVLEEIFNERELWGALDATTARQRLSSFLAPDRLVSPTTEDDRVVITAEGVAPGARWIHVGRSSERISEYLAGFEAIIAFCEETGENFAWG